MTLKFSFPGAVKEKTLKLLRKKTVTNCIVRKPFSLITSYTLYNGKRKSPIFALVFISKSQREHLGDLTIRDVKEKDVKTRGVDAPSLMHKVCFETDNAYLTSAYL